MTRKLLLLSAASGLMLSTALAQTPPAPDTNAPPPAAAAQPAAGSPQFISAQTADQWLTSKFKGTYVVGPDDVKVGSVSDILFQRDGKVLGYVVSVGGFLGMGSKDVALAPTAFQVLPGQNADDFKLKIAMTKDQLKEAPAFEPYKAPVSTTSMAPPRSDRAPGRPIGPTQ